MPIVQVRNPETPEVLAPEFPICWVPICQTVLTAPAATVRLPAGAGTLSVAYRSLVLHSRARSVAVAINDFLYMRFNGDAGANYNWQSHRASGANVNLGSLSVGQNEIRIGIIGGANATANRFDFSKTVIPDYAITGQRRVALSEYGALANLIAANTYVGQIYGDWSNIVNAITDITLFASGGNLDTDSRFSLYGIL